MTPAQAYEFILLALCVWREARGEILPAKLGVAWTIRNRAMRPSWWGRDWVSVILKDKQFSSFNHNDPNAVKWPAGTDSSWLACLEAAGAAYHADGTDPTGGATHYFDRSLDANPPNWATDGGMIHLSDIGNLHFWKRVT